jgi:hypothetical protein
VDPPQRFAVGEPDERLETHRTPGGLRREELAQLAGISVDHITRLEQGRATNLSEQVLLPRRRRHSDPRRLTRGLAPLR